MQENSFSRQVKLRKITVRVRTPPILWTQSCGPKPSHGSTQRV